MDHFSLRVSSDTRFFYIPLTFYLVFSKPHLNTLPLVTLAPIQLKVVTGI
jgi:hypothetical protein